MDKVVDVMLDCQHDLQLIFDSGELNQDQLHLLLAIKSKHFELLETIMNVLEGP